MLKTKVKRRLTSINTLSALKGRKTTNLLKTYYNNATAPNTRQDIAKQLLSAFTLEDKLAKASHRSPPKGSTQRKQRERYQAAVRACQLNHSDILLLLIRQFNVDPQRQDKATTHRTTPRRTR